MFVVFDGEDRGERMGDLVMAGAEVSRRPRQVNFMARKRHRGLICLALTAERCEHSSAST